MKGDSLERRGDEEMVTRTHTVGFELEFVEDMGDVRENIFC